MVFYVVLEEIIMGHDHGLERCTNKIRIEYEVLVKPRSASFFLFRLSGCQEIFHKVLYGTNVMGPM